MVDASSHAGVQFSFGPFGQLKLQEFRTSVKLLTVYICKRNIKLRNQR